jgi:hypothetical protein
MTTAMQLKDITIHPVVEQQGPFFDALEFFPTLTREVLGENQSWRSQRSSILSPAGWCYAYKALS